MSQVTDGDLIALMTHAAHYDCGVAGCDYNPEILKRTVEELRRLRQSTTLDDVRAELGRARAHHGPMRGVHEGWAVIYEELDELWDEVRAKKLNPDKLRKEALQTAAMCVRFIEDVVDPMIVGDKEVAK